MGEVRRYISSFAQCLILFTSQEQLIDVFKSVGQVVGFRYLSYPSSLSFVLYAPRLVFDRETGKPRGYGFCEFAGEHVSLPLALTESLDPNRLSL